MTDDFESAVRKVAREKNGDVIGPDLFWDIIVALDADGNSRHRQVLGLLDDHIAHDAQERTRLATELQAYKGDQASECETRHRRMLDEYFTRKPRRAADPDDADFSGHIETAREAKTQRQKFSREQLVANFWILVGLLVLSGLVNGLIDLLFSH